MIEKSKQLAKQAQQYMPGGVNSPVRAFNSVGGDPIFFTKGCGAYLYSVDHHRYIDYVCSWGAIITGHAHPQVIAAVQAATEYGLGFGATTEVEIKFAQYLCSALPSMERVRAVNSGTEATMSAIRLARGYTKRSLLIKFEGCYHGHSDALLVAAGSGALTFGTPTSAGVTEGGIADTLVLPYNDCDALLHCFNQHADAIAAVIIEPIAGNMNMVCASQPFLTQLRACCDKYGSVLIFDEVMSGFRVDKQCAQGLLGITPDLTCLGKVIGGGLAVAAFGGRADIMNHLSPLGKVYQAGTLSGNPIALAAGLATLSLVLSDDFFVSLNANGQHLAQGLSAAATAAGVEFCAQSIGGMLGFYFCRHIPTSFAEVSNSNIDRFKAFFHAMLKRGVYLAPSAYEAGFIGLAHTPDVIDETIAIAKEAFAEIA